MISINKKKSFTIIEILVVIMIVGVLSIGLMRGFNFFQNELTAQNIKQKLELVKHSFEETLQIKSNNFIYYDKIISNNVNGTNFPLYNTNILQSIFDKNNPIPYFNFLNLSEKDLVDFGNKPFDILIENKYFTHLTKFPYKNIYIISWGKLNSWADFDDTLKSLFINNNSGDFNFKHFAELEDNSKNTLRNWVNSKNIDISVFNKEISFVKITNLHIMKNKVENSINKFNNITNNIEHWVDAKIRSEEGTGEIPGKNNFMFSKNKNDNSVNITELFLVKEEENIVIERKMIDVLEDETESLDGSNISNVFSFIDKTKDENANDRFVSSKNSNVLCTDLLSGNSFELVHFVSLSTLTNNNYIECIKDSDIELFPNTKKMMGIISEFEAREDFMGIPFFIFNTEEAAMGINTTNESLPWQIFLNNVPEAEVLSNNNYRMKNSPPYSTMLLLIFPWITDATRAENAENADDRDITFSKYGWYNKQVFAVTKGL